MKQLTMKFQKDLEQTGEKMESYLQEDSLANHIQLQENERGKMMKDIYGQKCLDSYKRFPQIGSWAKTFSDLLIGQGDWYSRRSALIWKLKGTRYNRLYFQLYPKTLRTKEIEFGLLPTVTTQEFESSCEVNEKGRRVISEGKDSRSLNIARLASMNMLPTPAARYYKGSGSKDAIHKRNRGENNDLSSWATFNTDGKNAKLNPQFVAEMMGFPNKWTEKPFEDADEKSFDVVDFDDFPTSYPIVQEEFQPNDMTHSKWRRESIKGYGNAVVPTVVLEIFKAIEKYDKFTKS